MAVSLGRAANKTVSRRTPYECKKDVRRLHTVAVSSTYNIGFVFLCVSVIAFQMNGLVKKKSGK